MSQVLLSHCRDTLRGRGGETEKAQRGKAEGCRDESKVAKDKWIEMG